MRFVDGNVFIYAVFRPKTSPDEKTRRIKEQAKQIFERIRGGEEVATSVVHLSEVANFLHRSRKSALSEVGRQKHSVESVLELFRLPNVRVLAVSEDQYERAALVAREKGVGVNDALAVVLTRESAGTREIYTFDRKDFEKLDGSLVLLS